MIASPLGWQGITRIGGHWKVPGARRGRAWWMVMQAFAGSAAFSSALVAQLEWTQQFGPAPVPRHATSLVKDPGGGLLLFGGSSNGGQVNDTWRWRGGQWQQVFPSRSPVGRLEAAIAADTVRQRVVLFGGWGGLFLAPLGDTWEWDGLDWHASAPSTAPSPRGTTAAFDPQRRRTVLFGGTDWNFVLRDTWEWDGAVWVLHSSAQQPLTATPAMVFDSGRGRVLLLDPQFCGEWDGVTWLPLPVALGLARAGAAVWDPRRERVVWHGGVDNAGNPVPIGAHDLEPGGWLPRPTTNNPAFRGAHALGYDEETGVIVMFGGRTAQSRFGDTWLLAPVEAAQTTPIGVGCAGSLGVPELRAENRPWLGDTLRLALPSQRNGTFVALVFGLSSQFFGTQPLPWSLGGFGMTGCSLFVSVDAHDGFVLQGETRVPIANSGVLLGLDVFAQALVLDINANAGLTVSNGLAVHIGAR
ncbi:MAG: hypothetical protein IPK26_14915 [Planctomycetes bacterium]|nr:hypothetical protein [Planctomycetota bacterium]